MTDKTDYSDWSKEDLVKEIKKLKKRKKFGIVWDDEKTKEKFDKDSEGKLPILKEVKSKEIQTDNNSPTNILIEGDNYHSLSVLNYTHAKKIDIIYIDPPFNTGSDDFKYNDKRVDLEDTFRHSKWLSFIEKRLTLAKKLLSTNGVILISIDDNEYAQLKLLCDEIFGENNFITNIIWQSKTGSSDALTIDTVTEYILVYTRRKENATFLKNIDAVKIERFRLKDEYFRERGYYYADNLDRGGLRYSDSLNFPIKCPDGTITYPNGRTEFQNDGWTWKWGKEKVEWGIKNNFIVLKKTKNKKSGWSVYYKNYLLVDNEGRKIVRSLPYKNMITDIKTGDGAKKIKELFGYHIFKYTKPTKLISTLLKMIKIPSNGIIIDFMAGTGTTGESILELNKNEKTSYRFILCTNNENNICTEVCYPRLNKVIRGYKKSSNGKKVEPIGGNLKYFKTDFVDGEPTDKNKKKLVEQCTEMLCLKEDCFDELKQTKNYTIFKNHEEKYLGIIYDDDGIEPLKKHLKSINKKFNVYVFSLDDSAREEEFEDVKGMIDLKPIPEVILNVYRRIFR